MNRSVPIKEGRAGRELFPLFLLLSFLVYMIYFKFSRDNVFTYL
jgi:hypothetical protein